MIRNRVNHLQSNRLGLSLLASDALVVSLDGLLAGEVSLAGIPLVDQELHIHLAGWGDMKVISNPLGFRGTIQILTPRVLSWRLRSGRLMPLRWAFLFWL